MTRSGSASKNFGSGTKLVGLDRYRTLRIPASRLHRLEENTECWKGSVWALCGTWYPLAISFKKSSRILLSCDGLLSNVPDPMDPKSKTFLKKVQIFKKKVLILYKISWFFYPYLTTFFLKGHKNVQVGSGSVINWPLGSVIHDWGYADLDPKEYLYSPSKPGFIRIKQCGKLEVINNICKNSPTSFTKACRHDTASIQRLKPSHILPTFYHSWNNMQ